MGKIAGVILAGGKATRMGRDKALVSFRGEPMLDRVAGAIAEAGLEVLVVGRDTDEYASVPDLAGLGGGPAIGLLTALHHTAGDVLLVAVDQPMLRPETITAMIRVEGDAVVPVADGHPQVTCAIYRSSALAAIDSAVATGERKLRRILNHIDTAYVQQEVWASWGEDGRSWLSLDTPEAVEEAEALR